MLRHRLSALPRWAFPHAGHQRHFEDGGSDAASPGRQGAAVRAQSTAEGLRQVGQEISPRINRL